MILERHRFSLSPGIWKHELARMGLFRDSVCALATGKWAARMGTYVLVICYYTWTLDGLRMHIRYVHLKSEYFLWYSGKACKIENNPLKVFLKITRAISAVWKYRKDKFLRRGSVLDRNKIHEFIKPFLVQLMHM